ncbi:hypothetical protein PHYBLDRAFT_150567 [Phycomyces blakesleeanus NRRL 1555(-)]|uniref:RRM domain-containing protein n=2 Tax=Phycomyces blakesleeanus TaxID=4837 RepID=A0A162ZQH0_PHYB8|nr:hypothetical protein PHYBLDRAFT_150567 [Phycomyces blakesleeanus NRRL 1555(-)]OAD68391.1 hypothetical protein PHYBLDRAFT_150567 [Phycomyces blakesleeanus NRRL 1555(-)]|eukprot:XP_018286431.1 hypothetical protein PHYBLDRAFT_150567 [Phycomyces blakesleeanus NRRL 1555(-)]
MVNAESKVNPQDRHPVVNAATIKASEPWPASKKNTKPTKPIKPIKPTDNHADSNQNTESISDSEVSHSSTSNKRGDPAACIFVASLTKEKNDEELNLSVSNHFVRWGKLLNVKVLKDWMGRPYAFVQYETIVDAQNALRLGPGTILDGRNIRCEPARVNRTLCLGSLKGPLVKEEVRAEVSVHGEIEDITILHPRGRKYCAFVKYHYRDDAIKAFLILRAPPFTERWTVEWASNLDSKDPESRCSYTDRTSIFIGNLHEDTTTGELTEKFGVYGTIIYSRIIRKPVYQGHKRVYAFIKYKSGKEATDAIEHENTFQWKEKELRVAYRDHYNSHHSRAGHISEQTYPPGMGYPASVFQYMPVVPSGTGYPIGQCSSASHGTPLAVEPYFYLPVPPTVTSCPTVTVESPMTCVSYPAVPFPAVYHDGVNVTANDTQISCTKQASTDLSKTGLYVPCDYGHGPYHPYYPITRENSSLVYYDTPFYGYYIYPYSNSHPVCVPKEDQAKVSLA